MFQTDQRHLLQRRNPRNAVAPPNSLAITNIQRCVARHEQRYNQPNPKVNRRESQ